MSNQNKTTFDYPDDYFHIRATYTKEAAHVDFLVYEIVGSYEDGRKLYLVDTETGNSDTEELEKATEFLKGSVKWDGCSNLTFYDNYFHFCSKDEAVRLGSLLGKIYGITKDLLITNNIHTDLEEF